MCNRYNPTSRVDLNTHQLFHKLPPVEGPEYARSIGPRQLGPFLHRDGRIVVGQWGLIPWFAETRTHFKKPKPGEKPPPPSSTNNCRSETMASKPAFRDVWKHGKRCLVPADLFMEPYWGTGKNIWWAFARADSRPWMIAGLWNDWTDPETGEVVPSYTMVTMNADDHPLMKLMHKPDPKFADDKQDKRSVVPLAEDAWDVWLNGTPDQARAALALPPLEQYRHGAEDPAKQVALPV